MPVPLLHLLLTCLLVAASASSPCELGCLPASMAPTVDECRLLADSPSLLPDGPGSLPRGELKRCCDDAYTTYVGLKTEDLETDIKIAKCSKHAWRIVSPTPSIPYRARCAHSHARSSAKPRQNLGSRGAHLSPQASSPHHCRCPLPPSSQTRGAGRMRLH